MFDVIPLTAWVRGRICRYQDLHIYYDRRPGDWMTCTYASSLRCAFLVGVYNDMHVWFRISAIDRIDRCGPGLDLANHVHEGVDESCGWRGSNNFGSS